MSTDQTPADEPSIDDLVRQLQAGMVEPSSDARVFAATARQMFVALISAGFDDGQAIFLTASIFSQRGFRP